MKKHITIIFSSICILLSFNAIGQIQIGNGTNESQQLPLEPYYGYSYSQTIYLQSEINSSGMITGLQYYYSGVTNLENSDDMIDIWIGHTTNTSFASSSSWEATSGMTLVFSGSIPAPTNPGTDEWISITLTTPFAYNNTDNLIIAVDANEPDYDSSSDDFHCTSVGSTRSIYYRSDNTNPDPSSPPAGTTVSYIANVILDGLTPSMDPNCATIDSPADASSFGSTCGGDILLSWNAPGSGVAPDSYDVYFGTTSGSLSLETNTASTSYTKTGLSAGTYYWQIIPKNGSNAASGCDEWSFTISGSADQGTGDQNYSFLNSTVPGGPTYSWIDPVANGHSEITSWTSGTDDDGYFTVANMGISFNYYDANVYTSCHIGTNGYVSFGTGYTSTGGGTTIPSASSPDNMIAACMMDLDDRTDGQIFYAQVGSNFVVTWWHYHDYNDDTEWISIQLVMEGDADGGFTIYYNESESSASIPDILSDAVIGAEFGSIEGVVYRSNGTLGPIFCSPLAVKFENLAPLPIDLVSFEGKPMENDNMLEWVTASEENTEWHIIERSLNGENQWEEIGRLPAAGNTNIISRYELMDKNPLSKAYYRLRSVDFDLREEISNLVFIERPLINNQISLFPNPVDKKLTLDIGVKTTSNYEISIVNLMGQIIDFQKINLSQGNQQIEINTDGLSQGIYHVIVENKSDKQILKFVKQ